MKGEMGESGGGGGGGEVVIVEWGVGDSPLTGSASPAL